MLLLLFSCAGAPDDGAKPDDTAADTGLDTAAPPDVLIEPLADAPASVYGAESYAVGNALAFAGDDDGDGYDDALIAASFLGTTCLVRGPVAPGARMLDETDACWLPESSRDYAGQSVDAGRDLTGDGIPDLLVGAIGNDELGPEAGKVYLVAGPFVGGALADAPVQLLGESKGDYAGTSVAIVGDIDGDGTFDLLVGASSNEGGGSGAGRAYLFVGPMAEGTYGLGEAWATLTGEGPEAAGEGPPPPHGAPAQGDGVGSVLCGPGDVDGDGLDDLLVGANGNELGGNDAGAAAVFLGPVGPGDHRLADADQLWIGEEALQYVGDSVAAPGDLDGDGLADLLITGDTNSSGTTWVIYGPGVAGSSPIGDAPTRIVGEVAGDLAGAALAGAGDTDGDGWRDIVIGAYAQDRAGEDGGAAYLVRGPFAAGVIPLGEAPRTWLGRGQADEAGRSVAGGGDLDGDGLGDLLVGAPYADYGAAYGGEAYLLFGL